MRKLVGWAIIIGMVAAFPYIALFWFASWLIQGRAKKKRKERRAISVPSGGFDALRGTSPPTDGGVQRWTKVEGYVGGQFL